MNTGGQWRVDYIRYNNPAFSAHIFLESKSAALNVGRKLKKLKHISQVKVTPVKPYTHYNLIPITGCFFGVSTEAPGGVKWCHDCEHKVEIRDPYDDGEPWRIGRECGLPDFTPCPYGKLEIDQE